MASNVLQFSNKSKSVSYIVTVNIYANLLIIRSIEIEKKGQESTGSPDEAFQIEQLLHGYVASCHNAAMEFMKTNESRAAGRILRQCEDYCKRSGPPKVTQIVV